MSLAENKIHSPEGLFQSQEFLQNGKLERKYWYPDGTLRAQEFFRDGKLEGVRKIWHSNGRLSMTATYLVGERDSN